MKQFGYGMPRGFGWMGSAFTAYDKDMAVRFLEVPLRKESKVADVMDECRRCLLSLGMLGSEPTSRSVVVSSRSSDSVTRS